jgi:hypothetical protein
MAHIVINNDCHAGSMLHAIRPKREITLETVLGVDILGGKDHVITMYHHG